MIGSVPEGCENIRRASAGDEARRVDGRHPQGSGFPARSIIEVASPSEDAEVDWLLCYPKIQPGKPPAPTNLSALRTSFKLGEDAVQRTLDSAKMDGPLIVALQGAMGIGKSYAIDIADKLLFHKSNPVVLKEAYNGLQKLSAEQASQNAYCPPHAFRAESGC
jgi:hypothetical protein